MKKTDIALIGLGYVGLPLALAFAKRYHVVGFDVDGKKCNNLKKGLVSRDQCDATKLRNALDHGNFHITNKLNDTKACNYYIIAVPTPVSKDYHADPTLLKKACEMVGQVIDKDDTVVIESTVWPGMTEEICVPILEKVSGLKLNTDFFVGYSPERINPGDSQHPVERIKKIVSGSTPATATALEKLYGSILLKASKVMENCQRDVLIAFANEMHTIFSALGINTEDVIAAASTKWNFIPMHPGLVGGHCIPVDPYYLIDKADTVGIDARLLKTARSVNNNMAIDYAHRIADKLRRSGGTSVLLLGFAFKPNCDDIRNTRVADVYNELKKTVSDITICDPLIDVEKAKENCYDVIAVTTAHDIFSRDAFLHIEHKPIMHLCEKVTE